MKLSKKAALFFAGLFSLLLLTFLPVEKGGTISGEIIYPEKVKAPLYLSIFAGRDNPRRPPDIWEEKPVKRIRLEKKSFKLNNLSPARYYLFAFLDINGNGKVDYQNYEPTGWYSEDLGGLDPVTVKGGDEISGIRIPLKAPAPMGKPRKVRGGELTRVNGRYVLKISGIPYQRGYAHGFLLASQVRDMVEFFNLEFGARSLSRYREEVLPFVQENFKYDERYLEEVRGMLDGMRESGKNLFVPPLGRDVSMEDILALNAYGEWLSLSCSSVSAWGKMTENDELKGGLIIGRNMDGEIDLRKTTVLDVLIIAVTPDDGFSYVSVMWPGFIASYSAMNERRVSAFTHKSNTNSSWRATGLTPKGLIVRDIMTKVDEADSVAGIRRLIDSYKVETGGAMGVGNNLHVASPYQRQQYPAAIMEDDYCGGATRYPAEFYPENPYLVLCCNTFIKYGVETPEPGLRGKRYSALAKELTRMIEAGETIDTKRMVNLLTISGNERTEHAIIFRANEGSFDLAVEDLVKGVREAPLCSWATFKLADLFPRRQQ
jgi:hypothetical protein